jgi:hypothetical protein
VATLIDTIRRLTGAASSDVSDANVTAALARNRMREVRLPVEWEYALNASSVRTYLRGCVDAWGELEPTDEDGTITTVTHRDGTAVTGDWDLEQDGTIVFQTDQAGADLVVTTYSYDVNVACAEVMDELASLCAGDYTVKLGDQTFERGEGRDALRAEANRFRRMALPRVQHAIREDEAPSPRRVRRRAGWR